MKPRIALTLSVLALLLGCVAVAVGAGLVYVPAGIIVGGLEAAGLAALSLHDLSREPRR